MHALGILLMSLSIGHTAPDSTAPQTPQGRSLPIQVSKTPVQGPRVQVHSQSRTFSLEYQVKPGALCRIEAWDLNGNRLKNWTWQAQGLQLERQSFSFSGLHPGVYLLRVETAGATTYHRLLLT